MASSPVLDGSCQALVGVRTEGSRCSALVLIQEVVHFLMCYVIEVVLINGSRVSISFL